MAETNLTGRPMPLREAAARVGLSRSALLYWMYRGLITPLVDIGLDGDETTDKAFLRIGGFTRADKPWLKKRGLALAFQPLPSGFVALTTDEYHRLHQAGEVVLRKAETTTATGDYLVRLPKPITITFDMLLVWPWELEKLRPGLQPASADEDDDNELLPKRELIQRCIVRWPTVESDLNKAKANGLKDAAWGKHGYFWYRRALDWAKENHRLIEALRRTG
ncbi:hypothetical protein QTI17_01295 [Variovorax sp. J31P179]|uniref:hypothetical protein n=1 Tax=Variovorax sp. J31P179 TaxID=3053508 RepID=UPI0025772220|nr:hypothetical protein [Variovorax sp. J31P179]MDM0079216.1 hypothetical protein [Variovorax sp. J31P179]